MTAAGESYPQTTTKLSSASTAPHHSRCTKVPRCQSPNQPPSLWPCGNPAPTAQYSFPAVALLRTTLLRMGKIIITGPGRAGSSFLVQLLTRLGFDTGFEAGKEPYHKKLRAGCEHRLLLDHNDMAHNRRIMDAGPRVLKGPEWGVRLKFLLREGIMEVDRVLLPFRDLDVAAESRLSVGLDWMVDPTLTGLQRIEDQGNIHALCLGRTIEACIIYEIPCTILRFPLLVVNAEYCYQKLSVLGPIDRKDFNTCFRKLARPKQIVFR